MRWVTTLLLIVMLGVAATAAPQSEGLTINENCGGDSYTECTYSLTIDDPTEIESTTWNLWLCTNRNDEGICTERDRQTQLHVGPGDGGYKAFDTNLNSAWHGYDVTVRLVRNGSTEVETGVYRIPQVRGGDAAQSLNIPTSAIDACATGDVVGCIQESFKSNSLIISAGVLVTGIIIYLGLQPSGS